MFSNICNSCLLLALLSFSGLEANGGIDSAEEHSAAKKMNVYFISGLGADERVFTKLKLDPRLDVKYIKWVKPLKRETLQHYAARLSKQIDMSQPFQLVGLSFGGVIASEIADVACPQQVTLISSMSTGVPLSRFYQLVIRFFLFSPLSAPTLKSANRLTYSYFGADTPELKKLLKDILHDTDSKFLKWALIRMSGWGRKDRAENLFHIHGTADKLIPIVIVKPDMVIKDGGHLMVYAQADQISKILNDRLTTIHSVE
ncbi:alpha/beta hydrolase [Dyadobacter sp. CY261]|uniref:alpha/beta fold hydrolase n=1 Tax=Dyadobacter sp. CY261 TaxID=2907203 RepID=UPI001F42D4E5|nr:alpha/beta hydrolase [Dyadobacter sp. CY261]MCF0071367.1 alpha/beta hydrolase [Dyadobacter sp. CY261]